MAMKLLRKFSSVHYPVMWRDLIKVFEKNIVSPNLFLDCTLGAGGHSRCILETFPNSFLIASEVDKEIIPSASDFLSSFADRIEIHHSSYTQIFKVPRFPSHFSKNKKFDGIVLDLGMSSFQLENPERGFSFKAHGDLDMRFDRSDEHKITAGKIINFASELEISEIFQKYGEEQHSKIAAEIICRFRTEQKISTAAQLAKVLNYAFFIGKSFNKVESITKCFQALRIFVNRELENLEKVMDLAIENIEEGGVLAVISFHSLEDNIVYGKMKEFV